MICHGSSTKATHNIIYRERERNEARKHIICYQAAELCVYVCVAVNIHKPKSHLLLCKPNETNFIRLHIEISRCEMWKWKSLQMGKSQCTHQHQPHVCAWRFHMCLLKGPFVRPKNPLLAVLQAAPKSQLHQTSFVFARLKPRKAKKKTKILSTWSIELHFMGVAQHHIIVHIFCWPNFMATTEPEHACMPRPQFRRHDRRAWLSCVSYWFCGSCEVNANFVA